MKPRLPIPTGLRHSAQGCRDGEAILGHLVDYFPQPQRGCIILLARGFNPVGVGFLCPGSPRVARASQPWAGCRSPVGANELGFRFRSSGFGTRPSFGPRISVFGLQSYEIRHGPQLAPGEPVAERESFGEVVQSRCTRTLTRPLPRGEEMREAIRRLNASIPEEAFAYALRGDRRETIKRHLPVRFARRKNP